MDTNILKHKAIKLDALISLELGAAFYERLQNLLYWMYENNQEKLLLTLDKLSKNDKVDSEVEEHTVTLIALLASIEKKADEQGLTEIVETPLSKKD